MQSFWFHGWGTGRVVMEELTGSLPTGLRSRAKAPDLPGYGENRLSREHPARFISRLCAGEGSTVVGGWSLGAMAALEAAATGNMKPSALVLIAGCACFTRRADNPRGQDSRLLRMMKRGLARDPEKVLRDFHGLMFEGAETGGHENFSARHYPGLLAQNPDALAAGLDYLEHTDLGSGLDRVSCPVLLVHGDRDRVIDIGLARRLAGMLKHPELETIEGAGHMPFHGNATNVGAIIAEFIESVAGEHG